MGLSLLPCRLTQIPRPGSEWKATTYSSAGTQIKRRIHKDRSVARFGESGVRARPAGYKAELDLDEAMFQAVRAAQQKAASGAD